MLQTSGLRSRLAIGVSAAALLGVASPVWAQQQAPESGATVIEELVVTAQRREQSIQDVPLAVSAFSQESLEAQKLETGQDLLLAVPNVSFSRGNFGGFNFQIRGIGTKLVATSADAAIGVHVNSVPLGASTLADSEFFDIERVEILRGPQGTQFGRNSTGGVVNIITNKADPSKLAGSITGDIGNYETRRAKGFINMPLSDTVALRVAGSYVNRGGFGRNAVTGNDIDNRDLYSTRVTLGWEPSDRFDAQLLWEHFDEEDNRTRVGKQLCVQDLGLTSIGGVPTNLSPATRTQAYFSQGCRQADRSDPNALGAVNTEVTAGGGPLLLFGVQGNPITGVGNNANEGKSQIPDLRAIEAVFDPLYENQADFVELLLNYDLTDALTLSYSGGYSKTKSFTSADYNRLVPSVGFNPNTLITDADGVIEDPQNGDRDRFTSTDFSDGEGEFRSHEVRLQSSFEGPVNFSLGASYSKLNGLTNYYVTSNSLTGTAQLLNIFAGCPKNGTTPDSTTCFYVDPSPIPTGIGKNYFNSRTDYQLSSQAYFGELYFDLTDELRLTSGLRYTQDRKRAKPFPVILLSAAPVTPPNQRANFNEVTGRLNLEWSPDLGFTDDSLFYASYARGYKGGGFNPPESPGLDSFPDLYEPEFIDALEIGTKNTLFGGSLVLNGTAFYYEYKGYQVSSIIQRTSVNVNIDAKIAGAELEAIWEPVENLRFNANIGYLKTEIADGTSSLDLMNLTQGDPDYQTVKAGYQLRYNNCIAPVAQLAQLQAAVNAGLVPPIAVVGTQAGAVPDYIARGVCNGAFLPGQPLNLATGITVIPFGAEGGAATYAAAGLPTTLDGYSLLQPGIPADLSGNSLPNSPEWTVSLGAQYTFETDAGWSVTPRVDFYYQADAYSRIFNAVNDQLDSYTNINATLNFDFPEYGVQAQLYVKNATDEEVITDKYLTDDASGLFTNIFLTEPRTYGLAVTKSF